MCTDTTIYVSSYYYVCVLKLLYVSSYYYMCPHTTLQVSSHYCICVLILLYICPHITMCVLILLYNCPHTTMCPHATIYVSSYYCICVRITTGMWRAHDSLVLYVSSYYICVLWQRHTGMWRAHGSLILALLLRTRRSYICMYVYVSVCIYISNTWRMLTSIILYIQDQLEHPDGASASRPLRHHPHLPQLLLAYWRSERPARLQRRQRQGGARP